MNVARFWLIFAMLFPAMAIYTLFMIFPLADSMRMSFFRLDADRHIEFVGLKNYTSLLFEEIWSKQFFNALWNNFYFFFIHMLVQNPIGIALAAVLSSPKLRLRHFYRTVFFLPTMISVVVVGFIWQLVLSPLWGVSEGLLDIVGLGFLFQPWLGQESTALGTLALMSVWQNIGIPMMLIYAALLVIPEEVLEAAHCDGANSWHIFWDIKLPLIFPTIGIVSILTFVGNFNAFDLIFTTQGARGAPNFSTDVLGTFMFRTFFGTQLQSGDIYMGSTVAMAMFLIILAVVVLYLFGIQRRLTGYEL